MYFRETLEQRVIEILKNSTKGHDPAHMQRVYSLAEQINDREGSPADCDILHAVSWLHDIGHTIYDPEDPTYSRHPERSAELAEDILREVGFPEEKIALVIKAIRWHDDKKPWGTHSEFDELEVQIIQDADNLEAIGEIGVPRVLAYCKLVGMEYFIPELDWNDPEAKSKSALHDLYAHLNIYNVLNTETAKKLAKPMIEYQYNFIKQEIITFYSAEDESNIADRIPPIPCELS